MHQVKEAQIKYNNKMTDNGKKEKWEELMRAKEEHKNIEIQRDLKYLNLENKISGLKKAC